MRPMETLSLCPAVYYTHSSPNKEAKSIPKKTLKNLPENQRG